MYAIQAFGLRRSIDPHGASLGSRLHYAPVDVKPEGGVGYRVGFLTFSKKNYQNPHPRAKNNCQNEQKQMFTSHLLFKIDRSNA